MPLWHKARHFRQPPAEVDPASAARVNVNAWQLSISVRDGSPFIDESVTPSGNMTTEATKRCRRCGGEVSHDSRLCLCGARSPDAPKTERRAATEGTKLSARELAKAKFDAEREAQLKHQREEAQRLREQEQRQREQEQRQREQEQRQREEQQRQRQEQQRQREDKELFERLAVTEGTKLSARELAKAKFDAEREAQLKHQREEAQRQCEERQREAKRRQCEDKELIERAERIESERRAAQKAARRSQWAQRVVKTHEAGEIDQTPNPEYIRAELKSDEKLRWWVFARDDYTCCHCGGTAGLTVDHILPVSRGGDNDESNLQTLCRACNSRKGARID
jgi:hypothetical protein